MDIDFSKMNTEEILFDNLLDTSVDGNVFLEDLIEDPAANVLEQAMKENMVCFTFANILFECIIVIVTVI